MEKSNKTYFYFVSYMVIISAFLPVVFNNLPPVVRSHHIWAFFWLFSVFVLKAKILLNRVIHYLMLVGFIISISLLDFFWADIKDDMKFMVLREFYEIMVAISIFVYYRMENDHIGMARLARVALYCIIVTAILSIVTSIINPFFARDIVGIADLSNQDKANVLQYERYGGGGYGFYSGLVCLFPILIYFYKYNSQSYWGKKTLFFIIVLFFVTLVRVQFFANILVAALFILLSMMASKRIIRSLVIVMVMFTILYFIPLEYYINFLQYLSSFFNKNSDVSMKFNDLALFLSTGGEVGDYSEAAIRAQRFPLLMNSFLSNPLFGGTYHNHHMFWMNKLAMFGIIGTIPFIVFLIAYIRTSIKQFNRLYTYYFLLAIFSIVTLGFTKALFGRELWYTYFVVLPFLYYNHLLKYKVVYTYKGIDKSEFPIDENRTIQPE